MASTIQIFEVYRMIRRTFSEERAVDAVAAMHAAILVPVDDVLAVDAASISLERGLAMADSIIYTTAMRFDASVVTMDTDFDGLPNVILLTG